jgi:sn-glycerol 3-phosphate transport system ATP-binding protein
LSAIQIVQATKYFDRVPALKGVSLSIESGDFMALLGPSGCGKSTCLRLIAGLDWPDEGRIMISGQDVTRLDPAKRGIAMVFQSYALFPHLNVADNITFGLRVRGVARGERDQRLRRVADLVGLTPYLERKPSQLSGGQRQRIALARAVIAEHPVCLMDEPLSNLDTQLRHEMRLEIRALQQRLGMTMIYVTHDQVEAMTMADQIVLMRDGEIEQSGSPDELYNKPESLFVAGFIGAPPMNCVKLSDVSTMAMCGIRPEHVQIVSGDHPLQLEHVKLAAQVETVEYLGADSLVTLRVKDTTMIARVIGHCRLAPSTPVWATWHKNHQNFFDAKSGKRCELKP